MTEPIPLFKSKLYDMREDILRHEDLFAGEEHMDRAFYMFADEELTSLAGDLLSLFGAYEDAERLGEYDPRDLPPHWFDALKDPEELWESMRDVISIIYLKTMYGEFTNEPK